MSSRREFIAQSGLVLAGAGLLGPSALFGSDKSQKDIKILVVHTNDTHSRFDPFPKDAGKYAGLGGVARRKTLLNRIRKENQHVLVLDAGDFYQGTPYFNFFKGELEIKALSKLGYHAVTLGNHDFDAGLQTLADNLKYAEFKLLNSNYNFSNTPLQGLTEDYTIFTYDKIKIGVFGLGVKLEGLVLPDLYGNTLYKDPIQEANRVASFLKQKAGCNYVILLSHLGFEGKGKPNDKDLVAETSNIDFVIGGHSHTFMERPIELTNKAGTKVPVFQVGFAGINLGMVELTFSSSNGNPLGYQSKSIQIKNFTETETLFHT